MEPTGEGEEHDRPHPLQMKAWREMGASARSILGMELRQQARRWKTDAVRSQHPDWTEEQVQQEVARIYVRAHT